MPLVSAEYVNKSSKKQRIFNGTLLISAEFSTKSSKWWKLDLAEILTWWNGTAGVSTQHQAFTVHDKNSLLKSYNDVYTKNYKVATILSFHT